ncbi:winged helix-turn-helix domain-containing tetratricopeptide repeat protein [Blastomonas fulva]|uniref:OmpR/PhoB-type domain-containing protein n=1 Tax=Blastomonas fulva TaxID=1550728 RepID=A0ABN5B6F5_9SPHN|nr:winged helix-turn-helix domain-containing protein [Blastomonas fulva]ASR50280.1 hypothetical protein B5J99_01325 [Blastomonas fulva]
MNIHEHFLTFSQEGPALPESDQIFRFEGFELDCACFELRRHSEHVHVPAQILSLLLLLVTNSGRLVEKDEIIDAVWGGRVVSESAVAAAIKTLRKLIGDDGSRQRLVRTIHGKGFRFVGDVQVVARISAPPLATAMTASRQIIEPGCESAKNGKPSIAVLPFVLDGVPAPYDIIADALPADIIMDLSRLAWLFVIARGSSFRFRGADADPIAVGQALGTRYCLTGAVELQGHQIKVAIALVDSQDGQTIWAEVFRGPINDLQQMRPDIEAQVVAALEIHIPRNEVRMARSRPAAELDAWSSYHLGLDHMYRFTQLNNARAAQLFEQSLILDPHFSRALSGLSFTHFQSTFLGFSRDPVAEMEAASLLALRAVEADRLDPFACFSVGRSLWLEGRLEQSIAWFDRSTDLSPNFAQGIYNRGLVGTMVGDVERADIDLALALELSPLDPLAYAMVASQALIEVQRNDFEKAAKLGNRAALMTGAHQHIKLIAAFTAQLAGRKSEALYWLQRARATDPRISSAAFFRSFPFSLTHGRETIEKSLRDLGV